MIVRYYKTTTGREPYNEWIITIKDRMHFDAIRKRMRRIEFGNLGDVRSVGGGVYEIRIHLGPGYRVYFARISKREIMLLWGGVKKTQNTDILRSQFLIEDYLRRHT